MSKYYAIKNIKEPKIVRSWEECQKLTKGVSGVLFKSFKTEQEALEWIKDGEIKTRNVDKGVVFYVDGSFKGNKAGYGLVVVKDGKCIGQYASQISCASEGFSSRNVIGELYASILATKIARKFNIKEISIAYDYIGIEHWAKGDWKRNLELTRNYHEIMQEFFKDGFKINFVKIKAHTGNEFNELADNLAKRGVGGERVGV